MKIYILFLFYSISLGHILIDTKTILDISIIIKKKMSFPHVKNVFQGSSEWTYPTATIPGILRPVHKHLPPLSLVWIKIVDPFLYLAIKLLFWLSPPTTRKPSANSRTSYLDCGLLYLSLYSSPGHHFHWF